MRSLSKVIFIAFLCVYLIGPTSFVDAACKGSKCSRRRKSEEKQMNKEGESMTHMSELEAKNKKTSEEESDEEDDKKEGGEQAKVEEASKPSRMRRDHELKRTQEMGESGGVQQESETGHHRNRGGNHDHHHHNRRHVSDDCHSSEGDEAHKKHAQKAEPDSTAPARKRREEPPQLDLHMFDNVARHHNRRHVSDDCHSSEGEEAHKKHAHKAEPASTAPARKRREEPPQMNLHMFDNVARHHNRRHVSDDCHSSEGEEAHKKHANKPAARRRRSEHVQLPRFEDPEQHGMMMAGEAEDKAVSRKTRSYDHDKRWSRRDDDVDAVEHSDLVASHINSAHNRRTVKKRDSETLPNLKYTHEDEIAAAARHRMNLGGANAEHIRYPGGRRVGPFPERRGRVGPFPEDYPPFTDEHTDVMVERAMAEMEKELKHHHHKDRLH